MFALERDVLVNKFQELEKNLTDRSAVLVVNSDRGIHIFNYLYCTEESWKIYTKVRLKA